MPSALLEIKNLSKYFGKFGALEDISLDIQQGEIFGLLGPNGAGKTTLIKSIFKLLKASNGIIIYRGRPLELADIYANFGYLPEDFSPPPELTAREFLSALALGLKIPYSNISSLLKDLRLDDRKKIRKYSRGMIQRLGLATALLKDPEFIILDEPTLGLDPVGQNRIMQLLKDLNKKGKTIFFCSHDLFQVQNICNRIGVIHQARMKFIGEIEQFLSRHNTDSLGQAFLMEVGEDA